MICCLFLFFSAVYKSWLKLISFLHLALVLLMVFRLSTSFYVMLGIRPPSFLQTLRLPIAQMWEYVWLVSATASVFGLLALPRNRIFLVNQYILGTVIFGLGPVLYAMSAYFGELLDYYETRQTKKLFLGYPQVVLWNMFLFIAFQVHIFGIYFAWQLAKAWKPRQKKVN